MRTAGRGGYAMKRVRQHRDRAAKEQGGRCFYCGVVMTPPGDARPTACTAEHLKPSADGGSNTRANIVAACRKCNCAVHNQTASGEAHNVRQQAGLAGATATRNMTMAHALIDAFGEPEVRRILAEAKRDRVSAAAGRAR